VTHVSGQCLFIRSAVARASIPGIDTEAGSVGAPPVAINTTVAVLVRDHLDISAPPRDVCLEVNS